MARRDQVWHRLRTRAGWWAADLVVPLTVFWWQIGVWTLQIHAAPRMMRLDWTTYIIAPNYLRTAPILSWPLGAVPGYISPPGASIGIADANPLLIPLYRLANALSPDRPTQFVGWELLFAYVVTYICAARFVEEGIRRLRRVGTLSIGERVGARLVALMAIVMPLFTQRWVHVTLAQQWILVLALYLAVFDRNYDRRGAARRIGLCLLATAVQPYWLPMVAGVTVPYVIGWFRRSRLATTAWTAATVLATVGLSYAFGFIGGNFSSVGRDYGNYSADLTTFFNPRGRDKVLGDLPVKFTNTEGLAFPGLGLLILVLLAVALYGVVLGRRRLPARVRGVVAMCAALAVLAMMPIIRFEGRTKLDLSGSPLGLGWLGDKFRTNGRFVWPAVWLLVMGAGALLVAWRPRRRSVGLAVVAIAAIVQLRSTVPEEVNATWSPPYYEVLAALRAEKLTGATRVELQPPFVVYGCSPGYGKKFADTAPVLLAAAVAGMPVNSGYPARPPVVAIQQICREQVARFSLRQFRDDTAYVRPREMLGIPGLICHPVSARFVVCRSAAAAAAAAATAAAAAASPSASGSP